MYSWHRVAFMQRNTLLIVMVAVGSAFCWWPVIIQPNLGLPVWGTPLILIALITGLGTTLSDEGWRWLMTASVVGGFVGICCGFKLWWPVDSIEASYVGFAIGLATLLSIAVSVIAVVREWCSERRRLQRRTADGPGVYFWPVSHSRL